MTDPYYEADGVTLYHGDTLHILPTLPVQRVSKPIEVTLL